MTEISASRFEGRAAELVSRLMKKYSLSASNPGADILALTVSLARMVRGTDQNACLKLAMAIDSARKNPGAQAASKNDKLDGRREAAYILETYPGNYDNYIARDYDFIPAADELKAKKSARRKRSLIIAAIVIALICAGAGVYNLPYFKEKRAFSEACEAMANPTIGPGYGLYHYKSEFPHGPHLEEVYGRAIEAYAATDNGGSVSGLNCCEEYLRDFPDGAYRAEAESLCDTIWDKVIERFDTDVAPDATPEAAAYMRALLSYLKTNRINCVVVRPQARLNIKEYVDYDYAIRSAIESMIRSEQIVTGEIEVLAVKDQVTQSNTDVWLKDIINSVQSGFRRMLFSDIVEFVEEGDERLVPSVNYPQLDLSLTIGTQESQIGDTPIPDVWLFTSTRNGVEVEKSYVLGISADYDAHFTVPQTDRALDISTKGNPGSGDIRGDKSEAYAIMCKRCTEQFIEKIDSTFGIMKIPNYVPDEPVVTASDMD